MKIEVNIEKKHVFVILGALIVLAGLIFVVAQGGGVPNPGHAASEIGFNGENIDHVNDIYMEGEIRQKSQTDTYINLVNDDRIILQTNGASRLEVQKDGDVNIKDRLCFNNDCIDKWGDFELEYTDCVFREIEDGGIFDQDGGTPGESDNDWMCGASRVLRDISNGGGDLGGGDYTMCCKVAVVPA